MPKKKWQTYEEPLTTKVTTINGVHHCRLFSQGEFHDEMACKESQDIRLCFRDMLRWYDKLGCQPYSKMADAARHRGKNTEKPRGKVWLVRGLDSSKR